MALYADHHVLTPVRLAALRSLKENPNAAIPANLRRWLLRHGFVRPTEPRHGPRPSGDQYKLARRLPPRAHELTPTGLDALKQDDERLYDAARGTVKRMRP